MITDKAGTSSGMSPVAVVLLVLCFAMPGASLSAWLIASGLDKRPKSQPFEDGLITVGTVVDVKTEDPVEIAPLVDELTSRYQLLAARSGVSVTAEVDVPRGLRVDGDVAKLRRVMENLISNAIKFSPDPGAVHISLELRGAMIEFAVRDHGPGIDPAEHEQVFAPFHRAPESAAVPGVGLGLAIVKEIVDQHRGTISIDSYLGGGATFVVRLPVSGARDPL